MTQARPRRTQAERSAATREILLAATINALYELGYGATTTTIVTERAGISRGAMLHQFRTKADLMTFVVEAVFEDEIAEYERLLDGITDPREVMLAYPGAVWTILSRPSGVAVLEILQGSRSDALLAEKLRPIWAEHEARALQRLELELGRPASVELLRLTVWAAHGLSIVKVLAPDPASVDKSIEVLRLLLEAGLKTGVVRPPSERAKVEAEKPKSKAKMIKRSRTKVGRSRATA